MAHIHEIKDAETHFIINATTREISNAGELPALVQGDHNSEVFTFVANRFVDGHDLTACNKVRVHYLNIDSVTRKPYADVFEVSDLHIDETDSTKVVFTWLISKYATQYAGLLNFAIHFNCETEGVIDYSWKTAAFTGIVVKSSVDSTEQIMTEYTDILEKWKQDIVNELAQGGSGHTHENKELLDSITADSLGNFRVIVENTAVSFSGFLRSDKYYIFVNPATKIAITSLLNVSSADIVPEYIFEFISGDTPTRLSLWNNVVWSNNDVPVIKKNKKYIIRITGNVATYSEVSI